VRPASFPRTLIDADCTNYNHLNVPQNWDSCGINHAYYDPNYGWAGC